MSDLYKFTAGIVILLFLSGCAQLPSVGACRVAKYERVGDIWRAELSECRVIQSGPNLPGM